MFYDEDEFFQAVEAHKKAEEKADEVIGEIFSFERGKMPERSATKEDFAILEDRDKKWDKVIEIARRPLKP